MRGLRGPLQSRPVAHLRWLHSESQSFLDPFALQTPTGKDTVPRKQTVHCAVRGARWKHVYGVRAARAVEGDRSHVHCASPPAGQEQAPEIRPRDVV